MTVESQKQDRQLNLIQINVGLSKTRLRLDVFFPSFAQENG